MTVSDLTPLADHSPLGERREVDTYCYRCELPHVLDLSTDTVYAQPNGVPVTEGTVVIPIAGLTYIGYVCLRCGAECEVSI
jgi:hypothetical protein